MSVPLEPVIECRAFETVYLLKAWEVGDRCVFKYADGRVSPVCVVVKVGVDVRRLTISTIYAARKAEYDARCSGVPVLYHDPAELFPCPASELTLEAEL